jgi:hypothetical protein
VSRPRQRTCRWRRGLLGLLALLAVLPAAGEPLRVAVISDMNGGYGSTSYEPAVGDAVRALVARDPDLVISTGDMVAGQRLHPPLGRQELLAMWDAFHAAVSEPLAAAGIPFAVTPGNHDASAYTAFAAERTLYDGQWAARRPALHFVDVAHYPFDYAFSLGEVLFVSLDVTRVGALAAGQLRWLDRLLAIEAPRHRHRVVFSHLPVHAFTHGRETEVSGDRGLERLLAAHGVELYLSGHHHAFYPGYHAGIRYVSQACLGAGPRALLGTSARAQRAVTWLEFDGDELRITALAGPGLARRVDLQSLPESIQSGTVRLLRDDLRPRDAAAGGSPGGAS